jgi:C-terminal processing protease CtpA/Prc
MKWLFILSFSFVLTCQGVCADTILLQDGQEVKGVIVEEYDDRIVISTEKGEMGITKEKIDKVSYDNPEDNLVKLGAFYKDKGDYKRALYYYESARKINPDLKEAQDGSVLVTNLMMNKHEADAAADVAMKQDTEDKMGVQDIAAQSEADAVKKSAGELWSGTGLAIEKAGPDIRVGKVRDKSPAYEAGMRANDTIVSIWGKLVKYMPLENIYGLFLSGGVTETRVVIARDQTVAVKGQSLFGGAEEMIGARLSMEPDGMTVGDVKPAGSFGDAGILKGDRITRIGASSTRYMPLESAYKIIEGTKTGTLDLEIQRETVFWRK